MVESKDDITAKLAMLLGAKLDAKAKFRLLDFIDERPVEVIDKMDPENNTLTADKIESLMKGAIDFIICDSLFATSEGENLLLKCREEAEAISNKEGLMKEAGYGRGTEFVRDKKIRGDKFIWLN